MTPQEQQASDLLHTKLGVKPSAVADSLYLGTGIWAGFDGHIIGLYDKHDTVFLNEDAFRQLEAFAVKIGWRC